MDLVSLHKGSMMKSIILLSGGMDSAVILAIALEKKRECIALTFDYGQRHKIEIEYAKNLAQYYKIPHQIITMDSSFSSSSSSLTSNIPVPKDETQEEILHSGI